MGRLVSLLLVLVWALKIFGLVRLSLVDVTLFSLFRLSKKDLLSSSSSMVCRPAVPAGAWSPSLLASCAAPADDAPGSSQLSSSLSSSSWKCTPSSSE